jgi:hypothetical protein
MLAFSPVRSQSEVISRLVQASEAAKQLTADWTGFGRPRPAWRTEMVVSLRWHSASVASSRAGRKTVQMTSSTGSNAGLQLGTPR